MAAKFVILHHLGPSGEHWDLMLEHGDALLTWRLVREPYGPDALPIPAVRIADHRRAFLEYEGPLIGDRGQVRRVDAGSLRIEQADQEGYAFVLGAGRLSGRFTLTRAGEHWVLEENTGG